jgi:hypothetical protein
MGTFLSSAEGFEILTFSILILKFKKYRVRRFVHSLVHVIGKVILPLKKANFRILWELLKRVFK